MAGAMLGHSRCMPQCCEVWEISLVARPGIANVDSLFGIIVATTVAVYIAAIAAVAIQ
jgi:hypothetical protein